MTVNEAKIKINDRDKAVRIAAATTLGNAIQKGALTNTPSLEVNNHVHTTYSFSPYEPAAAAFEAWKAGLGIVGSVDHDSIGAAEEMVEAASLIGIASTVGFELRVSFLDTPVGDRKINNPDSVGIVYMCIHGVPRQHIPTVKAFLHPLQVIRNERNKAQVAKLNDLVSEYGLGIDFDADVLPLSRFSEGGSITERHILLALVKKLIASYGKGETLLRFLCCELKLEIPSKVEGFLLDLENPHYEYDLLGVLKSAFLPSFFIQPSKEEAIDVRKVVAFAHSIGAIAAYAYLGDVASSPTGDKKAENFEDSFLEELLDLLVEIGFPAITYMPPRNTEEQLARIQTLAQERGLMEISGVDINSSRQVFSCPELLEENAKHLIESAWALVAHEKLSSVEERYGLFHPENPFKDEPLSERIARYAAIAKKSDLHRPYSMIEELA
ncbi:MAG: PHP domain-containing protein [Sphaerochaeta sp.]